jgi:hypothetical protein
MLRAVDTHATSGESAGRAGLAVPVTVDLTAPRGGPDLGTTFARRRPRVFRQSPDTVRSGVAANEYFFRRPRVLC